MERSKDVFSTSFIRYNRQHPRRLDHDLHILLMYDLSLLHMSLSGLVQGMKLDIVMIPSFFTLNTLSFANPHTSYPCFLQYRLYRLSPLLLSLVIDFSFCLWFEGFESWNWRATLLPNSTVPLVPSSRRPRTVVHSLAIDGEVIASRKVVLRNRMKNETELKNLELRKLVARLQYWMTRHE